MPLAPRPMSPSDAAAHEALRYLVAAYGHGIDRRNWDLLRELYHPDAEDDHTPYYCGSAAGYIDLLPTIMAPWQATMHTALDCLFVVKGDEAQGEITARAWHLTNDGSRQFIAWGRYADHYQRRAGIWRFAKRSFILDSIDDLPFAGGDDFGSAGVAIGKAGRDDPVYDRLSWFGPERQAG